MVICITPVLAPVYQWIFTPLLVGCLAVTILCVLSFVFCNLCSMFCISRFEFCVLCVVFRVSDFVFQLIRFGRFLFMNTN